MHLIPYCKLSELPRILVITIFEIHFLLNHKNLNCSQNVTQFIDPLLEVLIVVNEYCYVGCRQTSNEQLFMARFKESTPSRNSVLLLSEYASYDIISDPLGLAQFESKGIYKSVHFNKADLKSKSIFFSFHILVHVHH